MNGEAPLCDRLSLNPISTTASSLYIKRGLRDQRSFTIDFLTPSFRHSLCAFPLLSNLSLWKCPSLPVRVSSSSSSSPTFAPSILLLPQLRHQTLPCTYITGRSRQYDTLGSCQPSPPHMPSHPSVPTLLNPWETLIQSLPSAEVDSNIWRYVSLRVPSLLRSSRFPTPPLSAGALNSTAVSLSFSHSMREKASFFPLVFRRLLRYTYGRAPYRATGNHSGEALSLDTI